MESCRGNFVFDMCVFDLRINAEISRQNQGGICHPRHYQGNITNI